MAETSELAILLTLKDQASAGLQNINEKFHGMGGAAQVAMIGVAALAAAGTAVAGTLIAMAEKAANSAMEVRRLARETGLTAEEASKLRYAGERLNIDTDQLSKSLGIFSKNLESAHPHLAAYNIAVAKTADGHIDMSKTLANIADRFKTMPDGVEKTAIAMQLFGKSGKDMIPLLNQGAEGLAAMGDEAKKMGLVFSKEGVDSAFKFGQAQKDLQDRFTGITNTIGMAVLPVLSSLFAIFGEIFDVLTGRAPEAGGALTDAIGPSAAKAIMGAVAGVRDTVIALTTTLTEFTTWLNSTDDAAQVVKGTLGFLATAIGTGLHAAVEAATAAFRGIASGIRAVGPIFKELTDTASAFAAFFTALWNGLAGPVQSAIDKIMGPINGLIGVVQKAIDWLGQLASSMPSISMPDLHIPGFAAGTDYVPQTMLAIVHQGERIIPAAQNRGGSGGGGVTININGDLVGLSRTELADELGRIFTQARRLQGLSG